MAQDRSSVNRILKEDLGLYGYYLRNVQALTEPDREARVAFAERILEAINNDRNFMNYFLTSDEARFGLNGSVASNTQVRYVKFQLLSIALESIGEEFEVHYGCIGDLLEIHWKYIWNG